MTRADRIAGSLCGAAIGDALGSAYELVDAATIHRLVGEPFVWEYRVAVSDSLLYPRSPGRPTDDTAMACRWPLRSRAASLSLTAELFARRFPTDLHRETGRFGAMFWNGGPGGATIRALSRLRAGARTGEFRSCRRRGQWGGDARPSGRIFARSRFSVPSRRAAGAREARSSRGHRRGWGHRGARARRIVGIGVSRRA